MITGNKSQYSKRKRLSYFDDDDKNDANQSPNSSRNLLTISKFMTA